MKPFNNAKFIESLFLKCPLCGGKCEIIDINKTSMTTKCSCTKWKINFSIREI